MAVPTFVDRVVLSVSAGRGGNGVKKIGKTKVVLTEHHPAQDERSGHE